MDNIYETLPGPQNVIFLDNSYNKAWRPPLPPRTIFHGYDQSERRRKDTKSLDRDSGQRVLKNQHNHDDDDQLKCAENSTSSVVVALIKFYEKSRNRVVDNKRDAANNSEIADSATYSRDKVSKVDHIPRAKPMELKPNYSKIVSEGTNAGNFGVAPGNRIVNGSGQGVKILQDNVQDGQSMKKKRKNSNSKLRSTFSLKNNSMDEFLLLVRKTKQKYKDLLEKDLEKHRKSQLKPEINLINDRSNKEFHSNLIKLQEKSLTPFQNQNFSETTITLNRQTSILLDSKEKFIEQVQANHPVKIQTGNDNGLKSELILLRKRCEELKSEKLKAENQLESVHLMSWEQLEKLHNLEIKQDYLEDENLKMHQGLQEVEEKNKELIQNITNLEDQVLYLKSENKSKDLQLLERNSHLSDEEKNQEYWKKEFETISSSLDKKEVLVEKLEFELVEMQNLIYEYEEKIDFLTKENKKKISVTYDMEKKNKDAIQKNFEDMKGNLEAVTKEKERLEQQNTVVRKKIHALELKNEKLATDLRSKISETKNSIKTTELTPCAKQNIYVTRMKNQLQDMEIENKSLKSKQKLLEVEKSDFEHLLSKCIDAKESINRKYSDTLEENLTLSNQMKENDEDFKNMMKKYKNSVAALASQQIVLDQQFQYITKLENENEILQHKVNILEYDVLHAENDKISANDVVSKVKISELKNSLEMEEANTNRLKTLLERNKMNLSSSEAECANLLKKNEILSSNTKNLQRQVKSLKTELINLQLNFHQNSKKQNRVYQELKVMQAENSSLMSQKELADQRLENLKMSIYLEIDSASEQDYFDEDTIENNVKFFKSAHIDESDC